MNKHVNNIEELLGAVFSVGAGPGYITRAPGRLGEIEGVQLRDILRTGTA
jgi:hypothetical protein